MFVKDRIKHSIFHEENMEKGNGNLRFLNDTSLNVMANGDS